MNVTRRQFIKTTAGAAGALAASGILLKAGRAYPFSNSPGLKKFIDPLPIFGPNIPLATADKSTYPGVDYYEITAGWYQQSLSSDMVRVFKTYTGTRLYGYQDSAFGLNPNNKSLNNGKHLGGAILATKGTPARLKFTNALPLSHIIPFDATIPMPNTGLRQDRIAVHLHGGLVPWTSDGGPFHWFANPNNAGGAAQGASQVAWLPDATGTLTTDLYYPNNQSARFMWYHDHAIGTTRTSAYAGLATGYIILDPTDPVETALGSYPTLILVFQDKVFWDPAIDPNYSLYVTGAQPGDLWYPYLYEKNRWKMQGNAKAAPVPSAIPEFFGDTMLVNGHVYPTYPVDKGTWRLRMLNACNARFLNLKFVYEDSANAGEPLGGYLTPSVAPVDVWVVGTEGGYLPAEKQIFTNGLPVAGVNALIPLLQGPAERLDLLVDFSKVTGNSKVLLYNDAPAPYPIGTPLADFYPGAAGNPVVTAAGMGPNTRTIMQFVVSTTSGVPFAQPSLAGANPTLPTNFDNINGGLTLAAAPGSVVQHNGVGYTYLPTTQELTLNEVFDAFGRLQQLVGTTVPLVKGTFGRFYLDAPTETAKYGTIQIWNIYNLTADTHPMHFHLFNVMVLRRRPFNVTKFNGIPTFTALGRGPEVGEEGWKETVKMWPGECTTVAVLVEPPLPNNSRTVTVTPSGGGNFTGTVPTSPRLFQFGVTGDEYVWHCHILEHEEHDMMRPLVGS
jgi:spore coat protein A, manganese oxidase